MFHGVIIIYIYTEAVYIEVMQTNRYYTRNSLELMDYRRVPPKGCSLPGINLLLTASAGGTASRVSHQIAGPEIILSLIGRQ